MKKDELIKFLNEHLKYLNNIDTHEIDEIEKANKDFGTLIAKIISLIYADYHYIKSLVEFKDHDRLGMYFNALLGTLGVLVFFLVKVKYETKDEVNEVYDRIIKYERFIEFLESLDEDEEKKYLLNNI